MAMQAGLRVRLRQKMRVMVQGQGDSSDDECDGPAGSKERGRCGQFVWPCPREYPADAIVREREKHPIPADYSKEQFGQQFKAALQKRGQSANIVQLHVFDEPHKRYSRLTGARERHKHVIFKMRSPYAHTNIQRDLAAQGIYGHFSFNLVGYVAYLRYLMMPSGKKLLSDLDREPWSYPSTQPAALVALCGQETPQLDGRSKVVAPGRKRKFLSFSEVTDIFVEGAVRTERDAWTVAKRHKESGDDALWNTLGDGRCVASMVAKVRKAWACEDMDSGTLIKQPAYNLSNFVPLGSFDKRLLAWLQKDHKELSLFLCGKGGRGKTELACALMHIVSPTKTFHFVNKVDRLRDISICPGEGLVIDEAYFGCREIDDAKALLDISKSRDVSCRNRDGHIPAGTPRIFSTNWSWGTFWPREVALEDHAEAIRRRILWIDVTRDLRKIASEVKLPLVEQQGAAPDEGDFEEDVFGFGFHG